MSPKIVSVVGARPQFVKAAVVSEQLRGVGIEEVMIHTGQHYDHNMSDVFFSALEMAAPRYNLGIGGGTHAEMTGRQLIEIERLLMAERPAAVLVYGDTNSTLAGALAAAKLHIPVAHVEAGLRSFNTRMPEEVNRILTDRVASILYAPSAVAVGHLRAEGVPEGRIVDVGDVMYDAALRYGGLPRERATPDQTPIRIVVTLHRADNTDDPVRLRRIVAALVKLAASARVLFPLHPRTRQALVREGLIDTLTSVVEVSEPLGYAEMLEQLRLSDVVVTDSGGLQKEAYFLGTPCVTLRDETEWTETVALGWNTLVADLGVDSITAAVMAARRPPPSDARPYGDGKASARIAAHLRAAL